MSKSQYSVSSVYYNNLDSGQHTINGKSYKSYQQALNNFNLLWDENDSLITDENNKTTYVENTINHLVCSLNHYKYNQDAKLLLKKIYTLVDNESITIDSSLTCENTKILLNSSNDFIIKY
tara:strand:+ start:360 stop:722 length:363 start_codon:yes stop_codon:yes gene_type:complete